MCKTVTKLTRAPNCASKILIVPGRHIKTLRHKGWQSGTFPVYLEVGYILMTFFKLIKRRWIIASEKAIYCHARAAQGVHDKVSGLQNCSSGMSDLPRVVTACLEPGPCHCATVVVGAFKNHTQQSLLPAAISFPRQSPVSLGTDNKYIIHWDIQSRAWPLCSWLYRDWLWAQTDPADRLELHKVKLSKAWKPYGFSQWLSPKCWEQVCYRRHMI